MVAYNFQKRFADAVESGRKRQTIRKGPARCKPGAALQLYTGQRTKGCRKLREAVCTEVRPIAIIYAYDRGGPFHGYDITLNWQRLESEADGRSLARADGFESAVDLCLWFEATHGLPFNGHVVNW